MVQYKNGRLYFDVVPRVLSICIPDGFWFNTEPEELATDYISLYTVNKEAMLEVYLRTGNDKGLEQELRDDFDGTPTDELDGPYPISAGSKTTEEIPGFAVSFISETAEYAVILDIGKYELAQGGSYVDRMMVTVTIKQEGESRDEILAALKNIVSNDGIREILESIRIEK